MFTLQYRTFYIVLLEFLKKKLDIDFTDSLYFPSFQKCEEHSKDQVYIPLINQDVYLARSVSFSTAANNAKLFPVEYTSWITTTARSRLLEVTDCNGMS